MFHMILIFLYSRISNYYKMNLFQQLQSLIFETEKNNVFIEWKIEAAQNKDRKKPILAKMAALM